MTKCADNDMNWPDGIEDPFPSEDTEAGFCKLPGGYNLYWQRTQVGGRSYASDEIGGGVKVWDTALVNDSTLLTALATESKLRRHEHEVAKRQEKNGSKDS